MANEAETQKNLNIKVKHTLFVYVHECLLYRLVNNVGGVEGIKLLVRLTSVQVQFITQYPSIRITKRSSAWMCVSTENRKKNYEKSKKNTVLKGC
jgi:hypothetical protein